MRRFICWIVPLVVLAGPALALAEDVAGLPLHVRKIGDTAIRVWLGDYISSTAVVAVPTSKGIVVIDTLGNPALDREVRKVIARELKRDDFKYLINTHDHLDHTGGNSVYADCVIVGHERCADAVKAALERRKEALRWYEQRLPELEKEAAAKPADSPEGRRLREELVVDRLLYDAMKSGEMPPLPTRTFADRTTLDLGDEKLELYYIGGMHSASDIAVFVPRQGLLMTGDTMADVWLTDTPGCLQSFMVRPGIPHDFPLLLENWDLLLAKKDQIRDYVPGHWNGDLTAKGFEDRVNYVRVMWEGINRDVKAGKDLDTLVADYELRKKFPGLVNSPGFIPRAHVTSIMALWCLLTGTTSAANRVYDLACAGAAPDAFKEVVAERGRKPSKYYFLEMEFNMQGYRLLQENKPTEAVSVFRLTTELYPGSWNAWDSLAEGCLKTGHTDKAIKFYEKSLELNPGNQNGKDALQKIRTASR